MKKFEEVAEEALGEVIEKTGSRFGILITEDPESGDVGFVNMGTDQESAEYAAFLCTAMLNSLNEFMKKECMH